MRVTCETCGEVYDDVGHSTLCPHEWFAMRTVVVRGDGQMKVCRSIAEYEAFVRGGED